MNGGLDTIVAAFAVVEADLPAVYILTVLVAGIGMLNSIVEGATGNRVPGIAAITITDLEILRARRRRPRGRSAGRDESGNDQTHQRQPWIGAGHNRLLSNHNAILSRNFLDNRSNGGHCTWSAGFFVPAV